MDTTNSSENPQRRVEDRKPEEVIDWAAPGAPAVPLSPAATSGTDEFMVYGRAGNRRADLEAKLRDALTASIPSPAATSGDAPADLHDAIMRIPCDVPNDIQSNIERVVYKHGHRDARHAAADLVLARADELKALATPSPQIAEVAELPQQEFAVAYQEHYIHPHADRCRLWWDKGIAASRRAAGCAAPICDDPEFKALAEKLHFNDVEREQVAAYITNRATPAPASAGQAAPAQSSAKKYRAQIAEVVHGTSLPPLERGELTLAIAGLLDDALTAQPAEGAGQAGLDAELRREVAMMYQLLDDGEWAEHIAKTPHGQCLETAITKLVAKAGGAGQAGQVAAVIDKGASWADATLTKYGLTLPAHTKLYAAPTERAAAPAEQPSAQKGGEA